MNEIDLKKRNALGIGLLVVGVLYVICPVDVLPGIILDDIVVALLTGYGFKRLRSGVNADSV